MILKAWKLTQDYLCEFPGFSVRRDSKGQKIRNFEKS